jgi:hypothetical protein
VAFVQDLCLARQALRQPALSKKLDEGVIEEEYARLEG